MRNTLRAVGCEWEYARNWRTKEEAAVLQAAREVARAKRMIFCISNGRSGTATLASFFACLSELSSAHEGKPSFHWVMRWAQFRPKLARDFLLFTKLPAIARQPGRIYVETSHLFGKGFFEPMRDMGITPALVLLRRDHRKVASSLYELGTIPGRTRRGLKWYLAPKDNVLLRLPEWRRMSDYQLCYWHCLEMEARQASYGRLWRARGIPCADLDVEELNRTGGFEGVAAALRLQLSDADADRVGRLVGTRANAKPKGRRRSAADAGNLAAQEREVERLIERGAGEPRPQRQLAHYVRYAVRGL